MWLTIVLALLAIIAGGIAIVYLRERRYVGGSVSIIVAIALGLLVYWSASTISSVGDDGLSPDEPTPTPETLATP